LFVFFDHESVGNLGSKVWADFYNIEKLVKEGVIQNLISIDLQTDWKPHEIIDQDTQSNTISWKSIVPSLNLNADFINELVQGHG